MACLLAGGMGWSCISFLPPSFLWLSERRRRDGCLRFRPSAQHDRDRHRPRPRNERTAASIQWGTNGHPIGRGRGRGKQRGGGGGKGSGRTATRAGSRMKVSKGGGRGRKKVYIAPARSEERERANLFVGGEEIGGSGNGSLLDGKLDGRTPPRRIREKGRPLLSGGRKERRGPLLSALIAASWSIGRKITKDADSAKDSYWHRGPR